MPKPTKWPCLRLVAFTLKHVVLGKLDCIEKTTEDQDLLAVQLADICDTCTWIVQAKQVEIIVK